MKLRRKHRILGAMVGTCSFRSFALDERTLPVELMPWETTLLLEKNIARLVSKEKCFSEDATKEQIEAHVEFMLKMRAEQAEMMKSQRVQDTQRHMQKILTGRKRKHANNEQEVLQQAEQDFVFDERHALIETKLQHEAEHFGKICSWPKDRSLISCVFRDCWQRGYYVMSGESFGADLLLYPGDPLVYHASHMIILKVERQISALDLICKSRISVAVNKICVLAYFDNDTDSNDDWPKVEYQTVERDNSLSEDLDSNKLK